MMAKWARRSGGRRRWQWSIEVIHDGEAGAVSQRLGVGCGDGLAAHAGVESCAAQLLEADAAPERAADAEAGESIVDG